MNAILTDKRYCPYKGIPSMTPDFVHYYLKSLGELDWPRMCGRARLLAWRHNTGAARWSC